MSSSSVKSREQFLGKFKIASLSEIPPPPVFEQDGQNIFRPRLGKLDGGGNVKEKSKNMAGKLFPAIFIL